MNSTSAKRYVINTSWLVTEKLARIAGVILVGVLIARHLGPEQYGHFSYAQSIVSIFSVFATLGLEGIVIRDLIINASQSRLILGSAFVSSLLGSIVAAGLALAVALWGTGSRSDEQLILIFTLALPLQSANVVAYWFQAHAKVNVIAKVQLIQLVVSLMLRGALVVTGMPVVAFAWATISEALVLALLLSYIALAGELKPLTWVFDKRISVSLLRESWSLIFTGLIVLLHMRIDQIMLKNLIGASAVGQFAVAAVLTEGLCIIPAAIIRALNPALIAARQRESEIYLHRLQLLYDLAIVFSIVAAAVVSIFASFFIKTLYGSAYLSAAPILVVFAWTSVLLNIGQVNATAIIAEGTQYQTLVKAFVGTTLNIGLNYWWINKFGIIGAALATMTAHAISAYVLMGLFKNQRLHFVFATKSLILPFALQRIFLARKMFFQRAL